MLLRLKKRLPGPGSSTGRRRGNRSSEMADNYSSLVAKPHLIKLSGAANYRTWSKDMEMILIRMGCWELISEPVPAQNLRTVDWKKKNNWARSEIHLGCAPDQQELILDLENAYNSWKILKDEYAKKGELKVQRLKKEFASVSMTEATCSEYINRVRRLVSELKACGQTMVDADVAYTMLIGLTDERYSSLVVTLTNTITETNPLTTSRVVESILTEESRLNQATKNKVPPKVDPNETNPLALKGDTSFKGELQHAMVVRTDVSRYRQVPYQPRGSYRGLTRGNYSNRGGYTQRAQPQMQQSKPSTTDKDVKTLPWAQAPWQPRYRTSGEERTDMYMAQQESRQCYGCGVWGHIRKNCYHEHPELHPANREWVAQQLNQMDEAPADKQRAIGWKGQEEASVMINLRGGEPDESETDDHPFEMNMVMEVDMTDGQSA